MKVLMLNGSPHEHGCTDTALREVASALTQEGVGKRNCLDWQRADPRLHGVRGPAASWTAGASLVTTWSTRCAKRPELPTGLSLALGFTMPTRPERCFRSSTGCFMRLNPTCSASSRALPWCRRAGAERRRRLTCSTNTSPFRACPSFRHSTGTWCTAIPLTKSGRTLRDCRTMRTLGRNMAWLLKCIEAGKAAGIPMPEREPFQRTNFIR